MVVPRRHGIEYGVSHHGDRFFITTNDEAPNFRLVSAPVSDTSKARWTPVLPYRPAVKVDGTDAFANHLVIYEREAGLRQVRIRNLATGDEHLIPFPEPVYSIRQHDNPEFDTTLLRFTYTSMVTPSAVVDYDMRARSWTVRKQTEVLGGYDPSLYRSERLLPRRPTDPGAGVAGVQAPARAERPAPALADRVRRVRHQLRSLVLLEQPERCSIAASWWPSRTSAAARRWAAHWYDDGKLLNKRNSFTDFIAAAEHLVAGGTPRPTAWRSRRQRRRPADGRGYQPAARSLRRGGGRSAVRGCGQHDARRIVPADASSARSGATPNEPEAYAYIRSYSPYDNVECRD